MKNHILYGTGILLLMMLVFYGCKNDSPAEPCNNTGQICIENKLDTTVTVSITQTHKQVPLQKDFMECFVLDANQPYTFSISGPGYNMPDTTLMVLPCDNKLIVLENPK
jgi:hypothetical protein